MSAGGTMGGGTTPFAVRTVAILIAVLVAGLISLLLLTAYAGDFRPGRNGGAHGLSTSAVGFSGLAELINLTGGSASVTRDERMLSREGLLVLTPGPETDPAQVKAILDRRGQWPTLIVLPKWITMRMREKPAWVRVIGTLPGKVAMRPLKNVTSAELVEPSAETGLRRVRGPDLTPMDEAGDAGTLVQIGDEPHYILADPDLINNHGLKTQAGAEHALHLLDEMRGSSDPVLFDVTLVGLGRSPNLLKLAFEQPFLPLTLCLAMAALLAVLHAGWRFGPARQEERAVAFGKRALAENGAALLRLARRRHKTGSRYAVLTRDAVVAATAAPPGLNPEALDRYLDRLRPEGEPFTSIATRAARAPDTRRLLSAARDLYHWRRTVTREHR